MTATAKRKPLTEPEREQILTLRDEGVSTHEISKRVGRARGTIRGFLKDPENYGRRRKLSGRRTMLNEATQQFIIKEVIKGTKTYAQIVEDAPMKMSVRTLQRFLRKCSEVRRGRLLPLPMDVSESSSDEGDDEEEEGRQQQQARAGPGAQNHDRTGPNQTRHDGSTERRSQPQHRGHQSTDNNNDEREPTRREMMQLLDRRFDEMTQKISQLVEGQTALMQLLLKQAKSGANSASSSERVPASLSS